MSIPPELRVLCHRLASAQTPQLVQTLGQLQNNALKCGQILSSQAGNATKADGSEAQVLVHRLKTQLSTLLYGKTPEGRLVAIVLIKSVINVGGWEVLKGAESWTRGLLAVLGKSDSVGAKKLCVLTLTSIYKSTHNYQNLIREISTPTLPTFVSACLNLASQESSGKNSVADPSLIEAIFNAFSLLVPRHPTIFRPSLKTIGNTLRPFLAPTCCDQQMVSSSLSQSARRLAVLLHQTAPKNTSGEEWAKAVRLLIKDIHNTADQVFRAVVEDWESSVGYVGQKVDVNQEIHGGSDSESEQNLTAWTGIEAGIERLGGLVKLLVEYFRHQTATAVTIPLAQIQDLLARLMAIAPPTSSKQGSTSNGMRLHPAIERSEREALWAGLPGVHVVALQLYTVLANRLEANFTSVAAACIDQVLWVFPSCSADQEFKVASYRLLLIILPLVGSSLSKPTVRRLKVVIGSCTRDCSGTSSTHGKLETDAGKSQANGGTSQAETLLRTDAALVSTTSHVTPEVSFAAHELLSALITYLPSEHVDGHLRAEMDQSAVLSGSQDAMLASIMTPHVGANGRTLPSLLPHLVRRFCGVNTTESLIRPRFPVIPHGSASNAFELTQEDTELNEFDDAGDVEMADAINTEAPKAAAASPAGSRPDVEEKSTSVVGPNKPESAAVKDIWGTPADSATWTSRAVPDLRQQPAEVVSSTSVQAVDEEEQEEDDDDDSDGSSVHLVMEMSDSEGED